MHEHSAMRRRRPTPPGLCGVCSDVALIDMDSMLFLHAVPSMVAPVLAEAGRRRRRLGR